MSLFLQMSLTSGCRIQMFIGPAGLFPQLMEPLARFSQSFIEMMDQAMAPQFPFHTATWISKELNVLRFRKAANISTFGPRQQGPFPERNFSATPSETAGIQTRPKFVQKAKLLSSASRWNPQPRALITMQIRGSWPNLINQSPGMERSCLQLQVVLIHAKSYEPHLRIVSDHHMAPVSCFTSLQTLLQLDPFRDIQNPSAPTTGTLDPSPFLQSLSLMTHSWSGGIQQLHSYSGEWLWPLGRACSPAKVLTGATPGAEQYLLHAGSLHPLSRIPHLSITPHLPCLLCSHLSSPETLPGLPEFRSLGTPYQYLSLLHKQLIDGYMPHHPDHNSRNTEVGAGFCPLLYPQCLVQSLAHSRNLKNSCVNEYINKSPHDPTKQELLLSQFLQLRNRGTGQGVYSRCSAANWWDTAGTHLGFQTCKLLSTMPVHPWESPGAGRPGSSLVAGLPFVLRLGNITTYKISLLFLLPGFHFCSSFFLLSPLSFLRRPLPTGSTA